MSKCRNLIITSAIVSGGTLDTYQAGRTTQSPLFNMVAKTTSEIESSAGQLDLE
jgi:hypothetical protein